ncbi:hypothetical protein Tco_0477079, partial [Tanacetum coccineum]
ADDRSPLGILLGVLGSSGSSSDVNPYHRRCRGRDVRDAVMGGGWTPDLVGVVGGDCGVLVIGGGGRPHDMVGDMVDCGTSGSHLDDALPA